MPYFHNMSVQQDQLMFAFMLWLMLAALPVAVPPVSAASSFEEHASVGQSPDRTASSVGSPPVQTSGTTILNWNSFSFATNEAVRLVQPSVYSIALNRVVGMDQSVVLGQLPSEDSQFILINPHKNRLSNRDQINTGEFLTTTVQIQTGASQADHVNSKQNLPKKFTAVVNGSTIHISEHGYVTLLAPGVSTEGVIVANVAPARSDPEQKVTLDLMSDGLIRYAINQKTLSQVTGLNGNALASAASNRELADAGGAQVLLSARSAGDIQSAVVNTGGIGRAYRLVNRSGAIRLESDDSGSMLVAETLNSSGTSIDRRRGQTSTVSSSVTSPESAPTHVPKQSSGASVLHSNNQNPAPSTTNTPMAADSGLKSYAPLNSENRNMDQERLLPNTSREKPRPTKPSPSVSGHPKMKSAPSNVPVEAKPGHKGAVLSNKDGKKVGPLKLPPNVLQDPQQSMTPASPEWRQPKWNFLEDRDDGSAQHDGNRQATNQTAH